ncbi:MAG: nucleotidyltransferase family protein [Muribaculaceae bacterium]|nr:nucleotidyltransferase family protein [Muribaculaceae bacterium]
MKGMIFAAGMGTRLRPLTDDRPKALVEVCGTPMLEHVILRMINAGIEDIVVNVHHLAPMIKSFLEVNDDFGITIHVSDESDELLDTGGGILKARKWLDGDDPFLVHNADIMTDLDLGEMMDEHVRTGADATLLVAERNTSRYLLFDNNMKMHGWENRKTGETIPEVIDVNAFQALAFGGIHVLSPSIFSYLEKWNGDGEIKKFSITPFYATSASTIDIRGYNPSSDSYRWLDIGKPETLAQAAAMFGNN